MPTGTRSIVALAAVLALAGATPARASDPAPSIRVARDRVFPTLVHLQPVFDHAVGGRTVESAVNGSGVVIAADGLVVTNFHVAGRAKRLTCTLADRRCCSATRVGADAATDLALVRLDLAELGVTSLPCASFATEDDLEPGDAVIAMGSPLGLTRSLSCGVVSCVDRVLPDLTLDGGLATGAFNLWIQTDAAINPGNSGGPLVNGDGEIVGINTRGWRGAENLGFAIPADVVREVVAALLADGRVRRATLGVTLQPVTVFARDAADGALVGSVVAGGPADRAGLRAGDVLVSVDGASVRAEFDEDLPPLRRALARLPIGAGVEVKLRRAGQERTAVVVTAEETNPTADEIDAPRFGLTARGLTDAERVDLRVEPGRGVLLTGARPGSPAGTARPALANGDVVLEVNGSPIDATEALVSALEAAKDGALLLVARGPARFHVALPGPSALGVPEARR